jgi:hypothetical protein
MSNKQTEIARAVTRAYTRDVAFTYRMGAGFAGDVNRMHPASIEPVKINVATPPTLYGSGVFLDTATNSVRKAAAGDTGLTKLYGIMVRPFPTQQRSGGDSASIGAATPPTSGVADCLRSGYIWVPMVAGTATKNGPVYMWVAADSGVNLQGSFRATASSGNTILVANAMFNGPADANGVAELQIWPAI